MSQVAEKSNGGEATEVDLKTRWRRDLLEAGRFFVNSWTSLGRTKGLSSDLLSGLTVAAVALPLNVALAVACGLPPSAGLLAGVVGGAIAAIFGGAPLQVTGPAAALQVMVAAIAADYGAMGVATVAMMIGVIQLGLALGTAGRFGKLVPESVLAGFTTGVGLKLLDGQIPELLGFDYKVIELAQMMHKPLWLHHVVWLAVVCGMTVALFIVTMSRFKRFPAALFGVIAATFIAVYLHWDIERVGAIPSSIPMPTLPSEPDEKWIDLFIRAVPLGLLASVESLLSASVVDRMKNDGSKHNPNLELFGQGLANVGAGLFGSMPVTGVVVRSSVNFHGGAKTRLSSLVHSMALLGCMLFLSKYIAQIPLAALAGLLCVIGIRLIEIGTLATLYRESKIEALAFIITAVGTVSGHLMWGLILGIAVAYIHRRLHQSEVAEQAQIAKERSTGVRAMLKRDEHGHARLVTGYEPPAERQKWLSNIGDRGTVARSAFVHHQASVIGKVILGEHVNIAPGSSVRADEGSPFFIGDNTNIQDGVVLHALKDKYVHVGGERWAIYVGKNVSIAHDALVHGPCYVGDETFIGFKAVVHDSVVGARCFVGIGAVVVGVEVPDGRFVPHGRIVDSKEAVAALPLVSENQMEFNEDVVEVNRGLAAAYRAHVDRAAGGRAEDSPVRPLVKTPAYAVRF
ncbi:hypothetical protein BH09MYX1_BH09MYX1_42660 [soil metagenome]